MFRPQTTGWREQLFEAKQQLVSVEDHKEVFDTISSKIEIEDQIKRMHLQRQFKSSFERIAMCKR